MERYCVLVDMHCPLKENPDVAYSPACRTLIFFAGIFWDDDSDVQEHEHKIEGQIKIFLS